MVAVCKIADVIFKIKYRFEHTKNLLKNFAYFENYDAFEDIEISDKEIEAESLTCKQPHDLVENLAIQRKIINILLTKYNAVFFHGSSVKYNNKGYVFTAPSGTGKSTHTALLKELLGDKLTYINDDKPILKVEGDRVYVYGSPWNGKHNLGENTSAQLKSICFIARGEENKILQISAEKSIKYLLKQTVGFDDANTAEKLLEVLSKIVSQSKFYVLYCNKDISAAKCSFEGMMYED